MGSTNTFKDSASISCCYFIYTLFLFNHLIVYYCPILRLSSRQPPITQFNFKSSIESLSCMHTVEHVGLGRYDDKLDPDGDLKAMQELIRVLSFGGNLLFVVPVGKPRIIFNAHRIFSYSQICEYFKELEMKEFTLIPDNALDTGMIENASREVADLQSYGCGCFWFQKIK